MPEGNLEAARRGYEHFVATGEPLEEVFHPDFVLDMSTFRGWPERQRYQGIDGLREFIADWFGTWEPGWEFEVTELREVDDTVLVLIQHRGRSKESGVPVEMDLAHVLDFKDGRQARLRAYMGHADGLAAVGLRADP
jgi:ketosteroid isomerase-like protein